MGTQLAFVVFAIGMIGVGVWGMRRTGSIGDFVLAGRNVGPWIAALSYGTSYFSAVVFIGFAGLLGWLFGLDALWIAVGNTLFGTLAAWWVLGRRTRRMSHRLNAMTMPEFFERRYESRAMKFLAAGIVFFFLLPYSAGVFKGLGHLFEVNFGISYITALICMSGLTGIYLVMGGYTAASRTDFIQGIIMLVGSVAIVAVLMVKGGGPATLIGDAADAYQRHLATPGSKVMPISAHRHLLLGSLVFMTSFGTWGLPQMIQKYYAIRDESMIARGSVVTTGFAVIVVTAAYLIGALSHAYVDVVPEGNFDRLVPEILKAQLPPVLMGLVLLLILSASMSTLASLILASASAVAVDVLGVHTKNQWQAVRQVGVMRVLTAVLVLLALALAIQAERNLQVIVTLISVSWGAVAGAFMAPYLYGLYWRGTTRAGAMGGMIAGLGIALVLFFVSGSKNFPISAVAAMVVPFAVVPLVSRFTRPPSAATLETAFGAAAEEAAPAQADASTGDPAVNPQTP